MGDPNAPPLRAAEIFSVLDREKVRYVVVGGLAGTVHGATRVTFDIDIVPDWTAANLKRLANALRSMDARLRTPGAADPVTFPVDERSLRQFEVSTWRTRYGDLDVIAGTPTSGRGKLRSYAELKAKSSSREAFGVTILIAALGDIIESKAALARESDLVALPELHRLKEREDD